MMKSLLFLLLVVVVAQTNADCPPDWQLWNRHCYKFQYYPTVTRINASIECEKYGAALVSVDSLQENDYVIKTLGSTDMQRESWYTSGVRYSGDYYKWMGDGNNFTYPSSMWFPEAQKKTTGQYVAYEFKNDTYRLVRSLPEVKRSYICEIDEKESFRIFLMKRAFDYGKPLRDLNNIKRGPQMSQEPQSALVIGSPIIAYMECNAFGNPQPTYEWRNRKGVITSSKSSRYTLTNGRLMISKAVESEDAGYYTCYAKNEFGTIRSQQVQFSFGELGRFNNIKPEGIKAMLYQGTNLKCQAPSHKPAIQFQWYKTSPNNFIRTNLQTYIFISRNGRLYFSEVSEHDSGDYFCVISLVNDENSKVFSSTQMPSRTSLGLTLEVTQGGAGNIAPIIQNEFPAVFPGQPLEGQTIRIECFAYGTATLNYRWSRKDKSLPSDATLLDFNRVLQIPNVQLEDGGIYSCHVSSQRNEVVSKDFSLNIQARPKFTIPLKNQLIDINTQLTWRCEASGKPTPVYSWYKNSVLLKSKPGKYIINSNVMVILNIQTSDNGMYQCQASNEFGTAFSTGELKALELEPNFYKYPLPPRSLASISGNGTIACRPEAVPMPTITFYKDNQLLSVSATSGHFILNPSGELTITNVQKSDEGVYRCEAVNNLGKASSTTNLTVVTGTIITIRPFPTEVIYNETAVMKCLASYNPTMDILYLWSFNGRRIHFENNPFYIRGTGMNRGDIYIRNAMYRHEGVYRCTVMTIVDSVWAEAFLTVKGPPGEPQGLKAIQFVPNNDPRISLDSRSVLLRWISEVDHGSPVTFYSVEFKSKYQDRWMLVSTIMGSKSEIPINEILEVDNMKATVIHNLSPASIYKFRIKAINKYGVGRNSFSTDWVKMLPDKPTKAPEKVGGGGGKVQTLTISWEPMSQEDYNGDNFQYIVYWRKKSNSVTNDPKWQQVTVPATKNQFVTIVGKQDYYSEYEVQVQGKNNIGYGPKSTIAVIYSAEGLPSSSVDNVQAIPYNATAITVYWDPVPEKRESVRGKLLGYRIKYWLRSDNESRAIEAIIYGQVNQGLVIGLLPNTYYSFRVIVFNSAGFGPRSDPYFAKCYHLPPQNYPTEVDVLPLGDDSCKITFRGISTYTNEEPIQGYRIKYWRATDNIRGAKIVDIGRNSYGNVRGLEKGIVYKLRVYAFSRGGDGKMSSPITRFTITKDGRVRKDMYDPNLTEATLAGASFLNPLFSLCLLIVLIGRIMTLDRH